MRTQTFIIDTMFMSFIIDDSIHNDIVRGSDS